MRRVTKFGLGCAMSLGLFATGAAIIETIQPQALMARADYTYDTVNLVIWFTTEMYVVIVAACVPTLRPLLPFLHGKSPTQQSDSRQEDGRMNPLRRRVKGYNVHDDVDSHDLQILFPPRSHGNFGLSREYDVEMQRGGQLRREAEVDGEELILPKLDANNIMKTTQVDVKFRNDLTGEWKTPTHIGLTAFGGHVARLVEKKVGKS